jgi:methyltransferase (TIGR00027 family)
MALFRALETARGSRARLFDDPWAKEFLCPSFRIIARAARLPGAVGLTCRFIDWRWPGARSSGVARTRYIDEAMIGALVKGIDQFVLLGAGFDCRPYRLAKLRAAHIFEVNHPDTSHVKQERLSRVLERLPPHVSYVGVDFNRDGLNRALQNAGLDLSRRIVFLWEGVTQYLNAGAVDAIFRYTVAAAAGSQIIFTYIDEKVLGPNPQFAGMKAIRHALDKAAEPWVFGFAPAELAGYLKERRIKLISDLDASDYRALFMKHAGRCRGYEFYRIAVAEVLGCARRSLSRHPAKEMPCQTLRGSR